MDERSCAACRTNEAVAALQEYRRAHTYRNEMKLLCDLCASTQVGKIDDYRHLREHPDMVEMQRQINYVGNRILDAIAKIGK